MSDPIETMFDEFADVTEKSIMSMSEQLRGFRVELEHIREEQRSALVQAATSAVEVRSGPAGHDGLDGKDGKDGIGKDGRDGKDAVIDTDEIVARVAAITVPRVLEKIPTPTNGKDGKDGAPGERGPDGLASPDEIRSLIRSELGLQYRSLYQGVFQIGSRYTEGQAATWDGSMWFATRDTNSKPGTDDSWVLAVKRGRDGRK